MKKAGIVALIVGIALTLVGAAVVFFAFLSVDFDFAKLNYNISGGTSENYIEKTYEVDDKFDSIYIEESSADIIFVKSDDKKARVETLEREDVEYEVEVSGKTLYIKEDTKNNIQLFSIAFSAPETYLKVYLPEKAYNELTIKVASSDVALDSEFEFTSVDIDAASGDITIESKVEDSITVNVASSDIDVSNCEAKTVKLYSASGEINVNDLNNCEDIDLSTASGDINIANVKTNNFKSSSASGDQSYTNVVAENKMKLNSGSGEILFYGCDAKEMDINTTSGEVYGEVLSKKDFITDTASGDVDIDHEAYGDDGVCVVKTASGDITIKLSE